METITSRQNETVKRYAKLLQSAAKRREAGMFLCEGARLCSDAARSRARIEAFFATEKALVKYADYCRELTQLAEHAYMISEHVAPLLSDTRTSQEIYCVCRIPADRPDLTDIEPGKYLAMEDVQNPANLGAAMRTAEALGVKGVILSDDCCDVYNPKALRASMGAVFRLPVLRGGVFRDTVPVLRQRGFSVFASVVDADAEPVTQIRFPDSSVLLIGNEGSGLQQQTVEACTGRLTIPMTGRAESLNAGAATSILLWEMMNSRFSE